jgi:hypothetical protein
VQKPRGSKIRIPWKPRRSSVLLDLIMPDETGKVGEAR